jgi:hypothetical protein
VVKGVIRSWRFQPTAPASTAASVRRHHPFIEPNAASPTMK